MAADRGTRAGPRLGDRTPRGPVGAGAGTRGGHRRRERHACRGTAPGLDRRRGPSVRGGNVLGRASLLHACLPERPGRVSWWKWLASPGDPSSWCSPLHSGRLGYAWLRVREFLWTIVAFHVSKVLGYVPPEAEFTMHTRRFYTAQELRRDVVAAGLRIRSRRERPVLPGRSLVVAGVECWSAMTERRLSFVIPARNEEALIGEAVEAILASVAQASGVSRNDLWLPGYLLRGRRGRRRERGRHCGHRGDLRR